MAAKTMEKLNEQGAYELSVSESNAIREIKNAPDLIAVCSGCTFYQQVTLKNLFSDDILPLAAYWFSSNFSKE